MKSDLPHSTPVEIVVTVDAFDLVQSRRLNALIDSLVACSRIPAPLDLVVIYQGVSIEQVKAALFPPPSVTFRYLQYEVDLGLPTPAPAWHDYWRRLVGLGYSRKTKSPFYMILDHTHFCIRPFDFERLLPNGLARTEWAQLSVHPEQVRSARELLGGGPMLDWGLSAHPVIYSTELANHTIHRLEERHSAEFADVLISLCAQKVEWSDNVLYTLANSAKLSHFHSPPRTEEYAPLSGLHTDIGLWGGPVDPNWNPREWASATSYGMFLICKLWESETADDDLLDRCYSALPAAPPVALGVATQP